MEIIYYIIAGVTVITTVIALLVHRSLHKKNTKEVVKSTESVSAKEALVIISLLDEMMLTKFRYYLSSYLLPYFIKDQEIEKKTIKKLKEDFYIDVSSVFNAQLKMTFLKVFDQKGIEIYIHQTFLRLLNESNIQYNKQDGGTISQSMLNEIYKG